MMIHEGFPKRIDVQIANEIEEEHDYNVRDANNNVILSTENWYSYIENNYGNYKTLRALFILWGIYQATHLADFQKAWAAWTATYNPIENYNGDETTVRQKMDGKETTTNSIDNGGLVNETQSTAVDNTGYRNDSKNIQTGSTTVTKDTEVKTLTVGSNTYTADYVEAETKNRHGNLGVTSTQNMITQEVEMRLNPLIVQYLDNFIAEYAYYIEGEL